MKKKRVFCKACGKELFPIKQSVVKQDLYYCEECGRKLAESEIRDRCAL